MSYTIEYNRKVYQSNIDPQCKLLLIRQGDNNCRELNGARVKDWDFIGYGWDYSLWGKIGKRAGYCEGGDLQRAKGWEETYHCSIEDYVKLYRKALAHPRPIKTLFDEFNVSLFAEIRGTKKNHVPDSEIKGCYITDKFMEYLSKNELKIEKDIDWYGYKTHEIRIALNNETELKDIMIFQNRGHNRLRNNETDIIHSKYSYRFQLCFSKRAV